MIVTVKREISEKLGTYYALYLNDLLIHYEFCYSAAKKIATNLNNGEVLYDIIKSDLQNTLSRKLNNEINLLSLELDKKNETIKILENEILEIKIESYENITALNKEIDKKNKNIDEINKNSSSLKSANSKEMDSLKNDIEIKNKEIKNLENQLSEYKPNSIFDLQRILKKFLIDEYELSNIEADELIDLIEEAKSSGFKSSGQLSEYIRKNDLGYKYPNISGVVKMKNGVDTWDFKGGFPPKIYKIVCESLNLGNNGTSAHAIGFKSFKELSS